MRQLISFKSWGTHDRRKVISVEAISNPRRFVPQTVTRDIISRVITRMPTPAEKWKDYPIETKDELFKDFMANLVDTKGHGPKGMKAEVWDALIDIWLKPEWKKKSDANRCNRASLPDAVLHT
ncbi:hypothetical protein P8452_63761 [Trifolium repens]|nr:hypothetical protein P8452_63761 [Trifolium repens]